MKFKNILVSIIFFIIAPCLLIFNYIPSSNQTSLNNEAITEIPHDYEDFEIELNEYGLYRDQYTFPLFGLEEHLNDSGLDPKNPDHFVFGGIVAGLNPQTVKILEPIHLSDGRMIFVAEGDQQGPLASIIYDPITYGSSSGYISYNQSPEYDGFSNYVNPFGPVNPANDATVSEQTTPLKGYFYVESLEKVYAYGESKTNIAETQIYEYDTTNPDYENSWIEITSGNLFDEVHEWTLQEVQTLDDGNVLAIKERHDGSANRRYIQVFDPANNWDLVISNEVNTSNVSNVEYVQLSTGEILFITADWQGLTSEIFITNSIPDTLIQPKDLSSILIDETHNTNNYYHLLNGLKKISDEIVIVTTNLGNIFVYEVSKGLNGNFQDEPIKVLPLDATWSQPSAIDAIHDIGNDTILISGDGHASQFNYVTEIITEPSDYKGESTLFKDTFDTYSEEPSQNNLLFFSASSTASINVFDIDNNEWFMDANLGPTLDKTLDHTFENEPTFLPQSSTSDGFYPVGPERYAFTSNNYVNFFFIDAPVQNPVIDDFDITVTNSLIGDKDGSLEITNGSFEDLKDVALDVETKINGGSWIPAATSDLDNFTFSHTFDNLGPGHYDISFRIKYDYNNWVRYSDIKTKQATIVIDDVNAPGAITWDQTIIDDPNSEKLKALEITNGKVEGETSRVKNLEIQIDGVNFELDHLNTTTWEFSHYVNGLKPETTYAFNFVLIYETSTGSDFELVWHNNDVVVPPIIPPSEVTPPTDRDSSYVTWIIASASVVIGLILIGGSVMLVKYKNQ